MAIEQGMTTLEDYLEDKNVSLKCIPPLKTPTEDAENSYLYTFYAYSAETSNTIRSIQCLVSCLIIFLFLITKLSFNL